MTTLQIQIDERVAEAIRQRAKLAGKSAEAWAADIVTQQAGSAGKGHWVDRFLEIADKTPLNRPGWKWNREELYDE